jgi:hypothetical protein
LGATATFRASAGGTLPFGYQWHYTNNGTSFPLDDGSNPSGLRNVLNLTNVLSSDAGGYFVVITNTVGSATSQVAQLTMDPTFIKITDSPVVTNRANWNIGSWIDFDDDGFSDLYMSAGLSVSGQAPALYQNNGGNNFVLLTTNEVGAIVAPTIGMSGVGLWGDFDNDDRIDLLELRVNSSVTSTANRFFRGRADGTFELITANIGVNRPPMPVYNGAMVDYDNDGFLDVYFDGGLVGGTYDLLYRNLGDGTFTNVWSPPTTSQYSCWADYDSDGDMDLWATDH